MTVFPDLAAFAAFLEHDLMPRQTAAAAAGLAEAAHHIEAVVKAEIGPTLAGTVGSATGQEQAEIGSSGGAPQGSVGAIAVAPVFAAIAAREAEKVAEIVGRRVAGVLDEK